MDWYMCYNYRIVDCRLPVRWAVAAVYTIYPNRLFRPGSSFHSSGDRWTPFVHTHLDSQLPFTAKTRHSDLWLHIPIAFLCDTTEQIMSRPAHKRAAGSQGESSSAHAPKKTRFVEPSEDPVNFAEEVDAQLEDPSAKRKGRVNTAGYDSDSSDDGEGVVLSRRPGAGSAGADEEEEDMFAMGEKEEKQAKEEDAGGKRKKKEFMRLGDIEGQEFGKDEGEDGDESEEEEEDEPEDEDDAERRKKAGMGFELSAFNMREEMEEGKFSADGSYVRTFDPHAVHDRWMDGMDEREIKKARKLHKHQEKVQREKIKAEERELEEVGGKSNVEWKLLSMLKKGETVLEALQRLGVKAKKNAPNKKK